MIDVSNPSAPLFLGIYPENILLDSATGSLGIGASYAFEIVDLENPNEPAIVGRYSPPPLASGINYFMSRPLDRRGTHLFVGYSFVSVSPFGGSIASGHTVSTIDLTDPSNPSLVDSTCHCGGCCIPYLKALDSWLVYSFGSPIYTNIRDFQDLHTGPGIQMLNGDHPIEGAITAAAMARKLLFLYQSSESLMRVFDASAESQLVEIANHSLSSIQDIGTSEDFLYLARGNEGLDVFRVEGIVPTPAPTFANPRSDIDGSNAVDAEDLLILLADWKKHTHPSQ